MSFVATSPTALLLERTARRYGQRPSLLLGVRDPLAALGLDLALAERARRQRDEDLGELLRDAEHGFFNAVIFLLKG